ncbi:hypothetical protein R5R35_014537 [Gryllus longicercus]|uniref:Exonuclease domain-containing protein n=1 Tax=Gryllus longicercus TaxID=2509291 RepID=A0AAN9V6J9_9ORTH
MPVKSTSANTLSFWRFSKRMMRPQQYKQFLVLDFEATCERGAQIVPQEIIEFPCLKVNASSLEVESVFHHYVRPTKPLTSFCTELTGITQEMVDDAPEFAEVFHSFLQWGEEQHMWDLPRQTIIVTCGDWDLRIMLPNQCQQSNLTIPVFAKQWINIKKVFAHVMNFYPKKDLTDMMRILKLPLQGRLHSGIDDCRNIHTVMCEMIKRGCVLQATSYLDG